MQAYIASTPAQLNGTVWQYWVAQKSFKLQLASTVLALLAAPIGNSDVERSLRMIKKTSLFKERGAKMTAENKEMINFIYVNAPLQLSQIQQNKR